MIPSPDVVSHKPKPLVATDTHRDKGDSEGYCDKTTARHADRIYKPNNPERVIRNERTKRAYTRPPARNLPEEFTCFQNENNRRFEGYRGYWVGFKNPDTCFQNENRYRFSKSLSRFGNSQKRLVVFKMKTCRFFILLNPRFVHDVTHQEKGRA